MNHGDAFDDMPIEYREYHERYCEDMNDVPRESEIDKAIADGKPRWMNVGAWGWLHVKIAGRTLHRNRLEILYSETPDPDAPILVAQEDRVEVLGYDEMPPTEMGECEFTVEAGGKKHAGVATYEYIKRTVQDYSEIDKAIVDGKRRWMRYNNEWQYVIVKERRQEYWGGNVGCILYVDDEGGAWSAIVDEVEILSIGEMPPPAKPEVEILTHSLNRCPDCDTTLESRSMQNGLEEWCPVCNVKVPAVAEENVKLPGSLGYQGYWWHEQSLEEEEKEEPPPDEAELQITGGEWWMEESSHPGYYRIYGLGDDDGTCRICEMVRENDAKAIVQLPELASVIRDIILQSALDINAEEIGNAYTLDIRRDTLWELYQVAIEAGFQKRKQEKCHEAPHR